MTSFQREIPPSHSSQTSSDKQLQTSSISAPGKVVPESCRFRGSQVMFVGDFWWIDWIYCGYNNSNSVLCIGLYMFILPHVTSSMYIPSKSKSIHFDLTTPTSNTIPPSCQPTSSNPYGQPYKAHCLPHTNPKGPKVSETLNSVFFLCFHHIGENSPPIFFHLFQCKGSFRRIW